MRRFVVTAALFFVFLLAGLPLRAQTKPPERLARSTTPAPQKDPAEAVFAETASKIVFLITRKSGEPYSRASGVILSVDGYIATNYHALQGADTVEIRFFPDPGDSEDYQSFNRAKLLYIDPDRDIAVLKVNSHSLPFLKCPAGSEARVGERVYAIGNPKGLSNTISEGIVSALRSVESEDVIQHTAPISPGSSGGALVDSSGALVGMNSWQVADAQNLNFAISAKHLLAALAAARLTTTALSFPRETSVATAAPGAHPAKIAWPNVRVLGFRAGESGEDVKKQMAALGIPDLGDCKDRTYSGTEHATVALDIYTEYVDCKWSADNGNTLEPSFYYGQLQRLKYTFSIDQYDRVRVAIEKEHGQPEKSDSRR